MAIVFVMTGACGVPGGIAAHNRQILRALSRLAEQRNLGLSILSFLESDNDRPPFLPDAAEFRGFRGSKLRLSLALFARAVARPFFIFDHVTLALPLLPFFALHLIKAVIFAHGSESWRRVRPTSRWLFRSARLVMTNSQFTLNKMRERVGTFNGVACQLGLAPEFELNSTAPRGPFPSLSLVNATGETKTLGTQVCLLVGRMHPSEREKGHYELLEIWPEIVADFPEAQLIFAGPGDDRENIARQAREAGVGASVFLPGATSQHQLRRLYEISYAFTMPSRQEGFGLVYLEAMNAAKVCLGCRDGGAEEVIVDGETGILIANPIDRAELVMALQRLLRDPESAREMGRRGFERLNTNFTAAHVQQRIYEQLVRLI